MNTKPSTPFGHFFDKIGIWEPSFEKGIVKAYKALSQDVQIAIQTSSGYIAIINANIDKLPDEIFTLIQEKYPAVSKDGLHGYLNGIIAKLKITEGYIPETFDGALQLVMAYLKKHEGDAWITVVRSVVSLGATIINPSINAIQKVELVLEYVYQMFIKGNV